MKFILLSFFLAFLEVFALTGHRHNQEVIKPCSAPFFEESFSETPTCSIKEKRKIQPVILAIMLLAPCFIWLASSFQQFMNKNYVEKKRRFFFTFFFESLLMGLMSLYLYFRIDKELSRCTNSYLSGNKWWMKKILVAAIASIFCWILPLLLSMKGFIDKKGNLQQARFESYAFFSALSTLFHFFLGWFIYRLFKSVTSSCFYMGLKEA